MATVVVGVMGTVPAQSTWDSLRVVGFFAVNRLASCLQKWRQSQEEPQKGSQ
jgi:hypothetical protein